MADASLMTRSADGSTAAPAPLSSFSSARRTAENGRCTSFCSSTGDPYIPVNVETFSNLAIKFSLGPEGIRGGDLGYFEEGQMPEEFDGVFKLKLNKISDVIQPPYGYHILKVIDKKPARKMEFNEARK